MAKKPLTSADLVVVPLSKKTDDDIQKRMTKSRYAMDSTSHKLLKETGRRAVMRLFDLLGDEEKWEQAGVRNQIALLDMAMTRAFGRVETVSADAKLDTDPNETAGRLPNHLRALAGSLDLPELRGAKAAKVDDEDEQG